MSLMSFVISRAATEIILPQESFLSSGDGTIFLISKTTGQLSVYGDNTQSKLGLPSKQDQTHSSQPTQHTPKHISSLGSHSAIIDQMDNPILWGSNRYGQLGTSSGFGDSFGLTSEHPEFKVKDISAGLYHTVAITENNRVMGCGSNQVCQLSNLVEEVVINYWVDITPIISGENGTPVKVYCGGASTYILYSSGNLYGIGLNTSGQLGVLQESQNIWVKVKSKVAQASAGINYLLLTDTNGNLFVCGDNKYGQLGLNSGIKTSLLKQHPTISSVTLCSAGHYHSAVINSDKVCTLFGYNGFGAINPYGSTEDQMHTIQEVIDVAVGSVNTTIRSESSLFSYGVKKFRPFLRNNQEGFLEFNPIGV